LPSTHITLIDYTCNINENNILFYYYKTNNIQSGIEVKYLYINILFSIILDTSIELKDFYIQNYSNLQLKPPLSIGKFI